jgi:hypothetical protein
MPKRTKNPVDTEHSRSLGPSRAALHLELFEQPGENGFSAPC